MFPIKPNILFINSNNFCFYYFLVLSYGLQWWSVHLISQDKIFCAFLYMERFKSLGSLKSFLCYSSQLSGASILCFHILSSLRVHCWGVGGNCNLITWWLQHPLFTDMGGIPFFFFSHWFSLSFYLSVIILDRKNDYFLWAKKKRNWCFWLLGEARTTYGKVSRILSYHTSILYKAVLYVFMLNCIIPWLLFHVSEVLT